jgi:hypothetical protein
MNKKKLLFPILTSIITGLLIAVLVNAWTNPSQSPSGGGGALYYSGGNVGIGTTTPSHKLHVYGGNENVQTRIESTGDNSNGIQIVSSAGTWQLLTRGTTSGQFQLLNSSDSEKLVVTQGGNVGIGTTSPDATLQVNGTMKILGPHSESYSFNQSYLASTDGFVNVYINYGGASWIFIKGYTDSSNPPTTVVAGASASGAYWMDNASMSFPVRKGNYWKAESTGSSPNSSRIQWTPLGN